MGNQVLEKIPILRGVRQRDPISPKLFTGTIQEVFNNAQPEEKRIKEKRWRKTVGPKISR